MSIPKWDTPFTVKMFKIDKMPPEPFVAVKIFIFLVPQMNENKSNVSHPSGT